MGTLGIVVGSALAQAVTFGLYSWARDKGYNPWLAGAVAGGIIGAGYIASQAVVGKPTAGLVATPLGALTAQRIGYGLRR